MHCLQAASDAKLLARTLRCSLVKRSCWLDVKTSGKPHQKMWCTMWTLPVEFGRLQKSFRCSGIGGLSDTLSKCWAACLCFPLKVNLELLQKPVKLQERSHTHAWRSFAALDDLDTNLCTPYSMKPAREDMLSAISCIFQLRCPRFSVAMAWRREKQTGTLSKVAGQQLNYQCSANSDSRHF